MLLNLRTVLLVSFTTIVIVTAHKDHGGDDDHVHYKFEYAVHDPHTKDIKSHHEERHGKYVKGYYTLKEPDGTTRVVHYRAGPHTGFEAIVERIGHAHHPHHGHHGHGHHGHGHHGHHGHHGGSSYVGPRHHDNQGYDEDDD